MVGNVISTFVNERISPMNKLSLFTIAIDCGIEIQKQKSNYGELRVSTFVKLASARMVCLCDV